MITVKLVGGPDDHGKPLRVLRVQEKKPRAAKLWPKYRDQQCIDLVIQEAEDEYQRRHAPLETPKVEPVWDGLS